MVFRYAKEEIIELIAHCFEFHIEQALCFLQLVDVEKFEVSHATTGNVDRFCQLIDSDAWSSSMEDYLG
jgi:hypothetical protein